MLNFQMMDASFPFLLALSLAFSGLFGGPSGRGVGEPAQAEKVRDESSQQDSPLQDKEKLQEKPPVLCTWIAYGKQEFMCIRDDMSAAQKKCNDYASKQLGEPAQCSCTADQSYIQDACKD